MMESNEDERITTSLRFSLLYMIKQAMMNPKIKDYVLTDSELPILLVAKLAHYYSYLPEQLALLKNPNVSEMYPTKDKEPCYHNLNLWNQIN